MTKIVFERGMTVGELIAQLERVPKHREVRLYTGEYIRATDHARTFEYKTESSRGKPIAVYLGCYK